MRYSKYVIFFTAALCSLAFALFIIHYSLFTAHAQNFIGPTTGAGVGQGAIGVDTSFNLAVGTSTPQSDTKLLIVGTSTTGTAGSGYYAIKVLDVNRGPLFIVRGDGSVSIGSPYIQTDQTGSTSTASGVGNAPANGALFVNGPIFTTLDLKAGGISVGTSTPQSGGNALFTGTVTAGSFSGGLTGTVSASNISSGAFGSNTGEGNYSFPASISVSTTTAPTGGVAAFMGNVGIGTTGPIGTLDIANGITNATGDGGLVEISGYINNPILRIGEYQNYLLQTEAFNSTSWVKTLIGTVTSNSSNDPRGTALAENIPAGSGSTASLSQVVTDSATGDWTFSVWLKTQSGTATIQLRIDSSAEIGTAKDIALTTVWKRFSVTQNFASANTTKTVYIVSGTNAISAWGAQLEPSATARRYSTAQSTGSATTLARTSDITSALRISGALTGATTGAFSNTITNTIAGIVVTSTDATVLTNTTAATVGVPVQMSPRLRISGTVWDTGGTPASKTVNFKEEVLPISGNPGTARLLWGYDYNAGGYSELMTLTSGGNVGIGTTGPGAKLDVHGDIYTSWTSDRYLIMDFDASYSMGLHMEADTRDLILYSKAGDGAANIHLAAGTAETKVLTVTNDGNVGIGTTNPTSTLTVAGAIKSTTGGFIFPDATTQTTAYAGGTQTIVAGNVSAGAFGSNTGGGNYSFPASLSIASTTAPTGGVLFVNGNVGIGTASPTHTLDVTGNGTVSGYLRVGSNSSPANTTAGDLTATRLSVGNGAFAVGSQLATITGTLTDTSSTPIAVIIQSTINPASDSSAGFRSLTMSNLFNSSSNFSASTGSGPSAGWFENRITNAGTINTLNGINANGIVVPAAGASLGTVTTVNGIYAIGVNSFSNALTSTISNVYGVHVYNSANAGTGPLSITSQAGVGIEAQTSATNNTALLIGQATIPTGNFGIYNASTNNNYFAGNVGIGTTGPSYKLDVVGTAQFSQPVIVGTPTATGHAATKSYVDSTVGGSISGTAANALACSGDATCEMSGANLNSGNIVGVNKLTVTTIDPLYSINGKKYSTYAASFAGGVKEEYTGKAKLRRGTARIATQKNAENFSVNPRDYPRESASTEPSYEYVIDFNNVNEGSDLWVWYKAIDFSKDSVEAVATPYGQAANIWYEIIEANQREGDTRNGAKIIFHGDKSAEFSFRLTGKRFDWIKWPTLAPNQDEKPSFIISN